MCKLDDLDLNLNAVLYALLLFFRILMQYIVTRIYVNFLIFLVLSILCIVWLLIPIQNFAFRNKF